MTRKFNGISKLMYPFSNVDYTAEDMKYKQELSKLDNDKIMTAFTTTLTDVQKQQLELPVKDCGIGIGGMQDSIEAMVLSNYLNIKDKIKLFIQDEEMIKIMSSKHDIQTFLESQRASYTKSNVYK